MSSEVFIFQRENLELSEVQYARLWIETRRVLEEARTALNLRTPRSWRPAIPLDLPLVERVSRWLEIESQHGAEVDECIRFQCRHAHWPELTGAARYFLDSRIRHALGLVAPLVVYGSRSTSIFPFPFSSASHMIEWLLMDWWYGRGRHDATHQVVEESESYRAMRN